MLGDLQIGESNIKVFYINILKALIIRGIHPMMLTHNFEGSIMRGIHPLMIILAEDNNICSEN